MYFEPARANIIRGLAIKQFYGGAILPRESKLWLSKHLIVIAEPISVSQEPKDPT